MKLVNGRLLLMCACVATLGWLADASMAQQFSPRQQHSGSCSSGNCQRDHGESAGESLELIPYRQSGRTMASQRPSMQMPYRDGVGQRDFEPRREAFDRREQYQYRRPYRAAYQGDPAGPNQGGLDEGHLHQDGDGSHQHGHQGHDHQGHEGCRGGHGHQANHRHGSTGERPYDGRQYDQRPYNDEADVAPSLSVFSPGVSARQWRNDPFASGR